MGIIAVVIHDNFVGGCLSMNGQRGQHGACTAKLYITSILSIDSTVVYLPL